MAYRIEYSPEAVEHLGVLTARQCATVLDLVPKYSDVIESPERLVVVKAVGIKVRDRVFVGREELKP